MATLSAGFIPVYRNELDVRILILRAYRNWDFPKGIVEKGEDPVRAAARELGEETGITEVQLPWGKQFRECGPYGKNKIARYYLAECHDMRACLPISPELGKPENDEYRWATFDEARELLPDRLQPILEWARGVISAAPRAERPKARSRAA